MINFPPLPSHVHPDVAEAIRAAFTAKAFAIAHEIAVEHELDGCCLFCCLPAGADVHVCGACRIEIGHAAEIDTYDYWQRYLQVIESAIWTRLEMIDFPKPPDHIAPDVVAAIHVAVEAEAFETAAMIAVDHGLRGTCLICLRFTIFVDDGWGVAIHKSTCSACWNHNFGELNAFEERRLRRAGLL